MPETVKPNEVHAWLDENLRGRPEFGFRKALKCLVLEPPSPFGERARRKPREGFIILVLLVVTTITCFLYFNVVT